jgi:hypothetical protein
MKVAASFALLLAVLVLSTPAQQKRPTPKTPPPTFDTLLPADTYKIYGEVRGVGQLVRSNSVNEILEPIMKLAGPPKDFKTFVKWLNAQADEVMTSRMLFAGWSSSRELPEALVAIEFASAEEAVKFQVRLNEFLPKILPAPAQSTSEPSEKPSARRPQPTFHIKQAGSLILITPTALNLKKLRPAGSKLLSEDVNFRVARNRFNSEPIFVFVDVKGIEQEEEERRKGYEDHRKALEAEREAAIASEKEEASKKPEPVEAPEVMEPEVTEEQKAAMEAEVEAQLQALRTEQKAEQSTAQAKTPPPHQQLLTALGMLLSTFDRTESKWPEAIGFALSLESDSFDVRALMINAPGEKSDPVPFLPMLIAGPPVVLESPNILPADTEIVLAMSLDFPQIYAFMSKPPPTIEAERLSGYIKDAKDVEFEPPIAAIEKQLKIKIKDDLLPLLGSEMVLTLPAKGLDFFGPPSPPPSTAPSTAPSSDTNVTAAPAPTSETAPVVAISLKDKEGMRRLLPKMIAQLGVALLSSPETERRDDTEFVSYGSLFAYAFIGDFLVLSSDVAAIRHVVDSYLKRETLSSDQNFKAYTRWQPRQVQGQIYISPALMEGYRTWVQQPPSVIDEQTRAFLTRLTIVPQPITYSLSNEGFGPVHELHLPKNLVLMFIAGASGAAGTGQPIK